MSSPPALHSNNTPRWGTPKWVIDYARQLLEEIHLDPATEPAFNQLVQALMIYTEQDNGLTQEWGGNVFLNPPGGLVEQFWEKLVQEIQEGRVEKAFWVGFSVEQLATLGHDSANPPGCKGRPTIKEWEARNKDILDLSPLEKPLHPLDFSTCILRKRMKFINPDGTPGGSPSHSNFVTAIGCDKALFDKLFSPLGTIIHGKLT